jgi:hypothetical protein
MRNKTILILVCLFLGASLFAQDRTLNSVSYVYTPNNSDRIWNDIPYPVQLTYWEIQSCRNLEQSYYPGATAIPSFPPTRAYNCHGYAWHMSNSSGVKNQAIWISWPSDYWTGGSYSNQGYEAANFKAVYNGDSHTACIRAQTFGGIIYRSKWGSCSIMLHNQGSTPYSNWNMNYYYRYNYYNEDVEAAYITEDDNTTLTWEILTDVKNLKGFNLYAVSDNGDLNKMNSEIIPRMAYDQMDEGESYEYTSNNHADSYTLEMVFDNDSKKLKFEKNNSYEK